MKRIILFLLFCVQITVLSAQTSRLSFEPMAFVAYGSSRINPSTLATTPEEFLHITSLGATYTKHGRYQGINSRQPEPMFEYGLLCYYELTPLCNIQFGVLSSQVGGLGEFNYSSASWARGVNLPLMISYQLVQLPKLKSSLSIMGGASLTFVNDGWALIYSAANSNPQSPIFTYYQDQKIVNKFGTCIYGGIQWKHKIYNGNSLNIKIIGALGLIPLYANTYTMTKNFTEKYYTEIISNGSYISFGIGYEFQVLKKYFGYNAASKKTGTHEYLYH